MDRCWRLAANPGFNASIDYIRARLLAAGFAESPDNNRPFVRVDEWGQARGWDYQLGTVSFADNGEVLLSRLRDRVSLCINSFPTAKGGIVARLVDVGDGGAPASYASADVKGAVVLGDAEAGQLWRQAVKARRDRRDLHPHRPLHPPGRPKTFTAPDQQDVLQWGTIPYDSDARDSASRPATAPRRGCGSGSRTGR